MFKTARKQWDLGQQTNRKCSFTSKLNWQNFSFQFDFLTSIRLLTQNQWSTSKIAVQILWVLWCADKREHINTVQVRISMLFPFTSAQTVPYIQVLLTKIFTCWESRSIKHYLGKVHSHSLSSRTCQCLHISTLIQVGLNAVIHTTSVEVTIA